MKFRRFVEASGLQQGFDKMGLADRLAQGRDIGEPFIISKLKENGINLTPTRGNWQLDAKQKIDAFLNGDPNQPAQIKLRTSGREGRNDIAYEVCLNHNDQEMLADQLKDFNRQGRDWKGTSVKHYFVMNQTETEIYYVPATKLRSLVVAAIRELNLSRMGGRLTRPFSSASGVQLRPTSDPYSGVYKVMAFVPVQEAATSSIAIT